MSVSRETSVADRIAAAFDVSRETQDRLVLYAGLLLRWNRTINLVSRGDAPYVWSRHIADSLQLVSLMPGSLSHAVDLGSGGGFPGLVLCIVTGTPFHLVESDLRKAAFLREAARETGAPAFVHACRGEAADIAPARLVTARALAPLDDLLELATRFLAADGICLFPKGREIDRELTRSSHRWNMRLDRLPNRVDGSGVILRISEVARV